MGPFRPRPGPGPQPVSTLERFSFAREVLTDNRAADTEVYCYGAVHQSENRSKPLRTTAWQH
jgi:hypothetical protein